MVSQFICVILVTGVIIAITGVASYATWINHVTYYTPLGICSEEISKENRNYKKRQKIFKILLIFEFLFLISYIIFFVLHYS